VLSAQSGEKPNILVIWGDDIGWSNLSVYNHAVMGYGTPNIDRIATEGALFTDHYAQPSCTAGYTAFITGQYPIRSGMTTVGQLIAAHLKSLADYPPVQGGNPSISNNKINPQLEKWDNNWTHYKTFL
jgi:arylsulfatase A-like enzyme